MGFKSVFKGLIIQGGPKVGIQYIVYSIQYTVYLLLAQPVFHGSGTHDSHFESLCKDVYLGAVINTRPNLITVTFQQTYAIFLFDMDMSYARRVRTASLTSYPVRYKILHQRTPSLS
jgi:hypothetical protein